MPIDTQELWLYMHFYTLYIRCRLQNRKRSQESYPHLQQQQQQQQHHQSHHAPLQQPLRQSHQDCQPIFATGINQGHLNQVPNYAHNELPPPYPKVGNQAPLSPHGPLARLYQDLNPVPRKQQKQYEYEGTDANSPENVYDELFENGSDFCRRSQVSSYLCI